MVFVRRGLGRRLRVAAGQRVWRHRAGAPEEYPVPRYPRYMLENRVENLMTAARVAVRQAYGRCPLGKMQSGQRVYVLFQNGQDETVWEAIRRAWAERRVDAQVLGSWDIFGMTKE